MSKPINDNLKFVSIATEGGELVPLLDFAGDKFGELINAVTSQGKAGTITIKVSVSPSTAGALAVKADVAVKSPKSKPVESLLWPTPEGNLMADDPRQLKMDLKAVPAEPVRELKTVGA